MKETLISISIIIVIFCLDIMMQKYTEKVVSTMNNYINDLRTDIRDENYSKLDQNINDMNDKWDKFKNVLSVYIEHDELEKVETYLAGYKSYVETHDKDMALSDLDKTEFILEHISNKYKFTIENII